MAGGGTPRQKMIGMMYLVLTALLALNVSKSILDSFVVVNEGLEKTTENFGKKNEQSYKAFEMAMKGKEAEKAKPYNELALKAKKICSELVEYVDVMKKMAIQETDKLQKEVADTISLHYVNAKDNFDVPAQVLLGSEEAPKKDKYSMADLKIQINKLREELVSIFEKNPKLFLPNVIKDMKLKLEGDLHTEDPRPVEGMAQETWEMEKVLHVPLAAVITNLTAIQADVRNAESDVVSQLLNSINAADFKFDKLVAKVIAPSSYLIVGQEYKADVLLVAFNSTQNPEIVVGPCDTTRADENKDPMRGPGKPIPVEGGLGKYKAGTGAEGPQKWSGCIKVANPTGGFKYYPFASEYMVARPAATVSADKMNVFYIGVENPVTISCPGVALSDLVPSLQGSGSIAPAAEKGKFTVKVSGGIDATINVSAKMGKDTKPMAGIKFRVKKLPDPVAICAGTKGGSVKKSALSAAGGVIAKYENFDFDLKISVSSFNLTVNVGGEFKTYEAKGNQFTAAQIDAINKVKNNGRVIIEDIKCNLPDGTKRDLGTITLKVQT
jgi:gliding motility-associated protein GldM